MPVVPTAEPTVTCQRAPRRPEGGHAANVGLGEGCRIYQPHRREPQTNPSGAARAGLRPKHRSAWGTQSGAAHPEGGTGEAAEERGGSRA